MYIIFNIISLTFHPKINVTTMPPIRIWIEQCNHFPFQPVPSISTKHKKSQKVAELEDLLDHCAVRSVKHKLSNEVLYFYDLVYYPHLFLILQKHRAKHHQKLAFVPLQIIQNYHLYSMIVHQQNAYLRNL